jgi:hypothetical protein
MAAAAAGGGRAAALAAVAGGGGSGAGAGAVKAEPSAAAPAVAGVKRSRRGAVHVEFSLPPYSLKAPGFGFNHRSYQVMKNWFQSLLSNPTCTATSRSEDDIPGAPPSKVGGCTS